MARRLERIDRPIKVLTEDIYALSSLKTMLYVAAPRLLPALLVLLIPVLAPGDYFQRVATLAAIYGLLGSPRADIKVFPGDEFWVAFDIENIKFDETGNLTHDPTRQAIRELLGAFGLWIERLR